MPRILLIDKKMFCEKHQEYLMKFKDMANGDFYLCIKCDCEEEERESGKHGKNKM